MHGGWKGREMEVAEGDTATAAGGSGGSAGHHDERDCPFRLANTGAIGFLSAAALLLLLLLPVVVRGDFSLNSSRNYAANNTSLYSRVN